MVICKTKILTKILTIMYWRNSVLRLVLNVGIVNVRWFPPKPFGMQWSDVLALISLAGYCWRKYYSIPVFLKNYGAAGRATAWNSHISYWSAWFKSCIVCFWFSFTLVEKDDGSITWISATHMRELDEVPGLLTSIWSSVWGRNQ